MNLRLKMFDFHPVKFDEHTLNKYVSLFSTCFKKSDKYTPNYIRWLYCENPAGSAVGFDAWDGGQLAAHYVCVPAHASVGGNAVNVLLSLNTATHPSYQGKGLFTKLAEMTYAAGAEKGFDSVYGVANANSTPGFTRKLGFRLVESLAARVGVGSLYIDYEVSTNRAQFERIWSPSSLNWRCANPGNTVFHRKHRGLVEFHASAFGKLLPVYAELSFQRVLNIGNNTGKYLSPCRLFLGLVPEGACMFKQYFDIPQCLRPSPLNFIYRSLSANTQKLEKGQVSLSFLDFDAY